MASRDAPAKSTALNAVGNGGVAAVDRAFSILAAFKPADERLTLAELAVRTELYKSTILRLAGSLLRHGYLQRLEDGRYQIGPAPFLLGALHQRSLRLGDIMLPLMRELADQAAEGVSFYIRRDSVRICLHRIDSRHAIRDHVREGDILPLDRGSGGRVLSAFSGARGEPHDTTRKTFLYVSIGERDRETAGVSAPVFGPQQQLLGALTLAGPRSRFDETFIAGALAPLLDTAARATAALGGDASPLRAAMASLAPPRGAKRRTGG